MQTSTGLSQDTCSYKTQITVYTTEKDAITTLL